MIAFNLFSEPFTNALGWALVHTLWQGTLLVAAAALALRLTQKQPSSVRYGIGIGTLALQLLIFLGTLWVCYEPVRATMLIRGDQQTALILNLPITSDWSGQLTFWLNQHLSLVVTAWLCGAVLLLVRLFGGWLFVQRLTRRNINPAPQAWQTYLQTLSNQLGITQAVRLVESAEISVPMTIGWLKPIVLLPIGLLAGLSPRQVEAVLAHELAHIRRYDYLVNLVQSAVEIVLFFHPAIWWLSARVREEREHCCDDVAIQLRGERASLAQALVHIEERRQAVLATPALAMAFGARKQSFMQRVKRVIGVSEQQSTKPNGLLVAGCLILVAGLVTGQQVYRPAKTSRRHGDTITINTWKSDTAIQQSIQEEIKVSLVEKLEPVLSSMDTDTIDPITRIRLEKELDHHMEQVDRLERELEKINEPMIKLHKQLELKSQVHRLNEVEIEKINEKMAKIQNELGQSVQKATEIELKRARSNGKLSQIDLQQLKESQLDMARIQKKMDQLNEGAIAQMHEKMQALNEGPMRILNDSMGVFSAKAAKLAEKASLHVVEISKLHEKLYSLDSVPAMPPFPEPVPVIAPVPNVSPRPARMPRPAGVKGQYWHNGKRYNSPQEMPKAAIAPVPPVAPAVAPVSPPEPLPAIAPVVPEPAEPAEPTEHVRIKHGKNNDFQKTKTPKPAKSAKSSKAKTTLKPTPKPKEK